jgi:hypothetical protein
LKRFILLLAILLCAGCMQAQEDFDKTPTIGLLAGAVNYQGDLKPNSFTFEHSNLLVSLSIRKPLSRWFSVRGGLSMGKVEAADRYNRDYLQIRNLSFDSKLSEAYALLEVDLLNIETAHVTPYLLGGGVLFHYNPYTFDQAGKKVYLQPLSTEGQGLPEYPDRKVYPLTQKALAMGGGVRVAVSNCMFVSLEFSQRKTFTDYLDDVSTSFVDESKLLAARGAKAVELAFRGDEVNPATNYPPHGEQRGTPTEADWYYFTALNVEMRLSCLKEKMSGALRHRVSRNYYRKCPRFY